MWSKRFIYLMFGFPLLAFTQTACALNVTHPATSEVIAAGDDYATQVLGNAWDMNDSVDIDVQESTPYFTGLTFSSSSFSGATAIDGAGLYPLFMGYQNSINLNLNRGVNFPVDTTHYRYLTAKLTVGSTGQCVRVYFLLDPNSYNPSENTIGVSGCPSLVASQSSIVTIDLVNDSDPSSTIHWTQYPQITGLRVDPANGHPVNFSIDWIRLTAAAGSVQKYTVQWTDSGYSGTYSIGAIDNGGSGTPYALGSHISGVSYAADLTFLQPGMYTIKVTRDTGGTSAASGVFTINSPPQVSLTAPNASGDTSKDFATSIVGNAWTQGSFSDSDFASISNFKSHSYPGGNFVGRPLTGDPGWLFNLGGHAIDTSIYRSLCFSMEVFGQRSIGGGSVARVFWGNNPGLLTTSQQIPLDDNLNDTTIGNYCVADLAAYAPDSGSPVNGGLWTGTKTVFRIDPDEFTPPSGCSDADTCHDVQLNSVTLSPFAQANPNYTFKWTLADANDASDDVTLYLDPDTTPLNGNEIMIHSATVATGNGQYAWTGAGSVNYGTYHVLIVADDGKNSVAQYAGGPLVVGARDGIFRYGFESQQ